MGRKQKGNKLPPFVPLPWEVLNHRSYRDLIPSAAKVLPFFLGKVKFSPYKSPQRYMESFHFPYSEARRCGFPHSTFTRTIEDLIDKGFIDPVGKGGLKSYGLGCNTFRLSQRWVKYGTPSFESRKWEKLSLNKKKGKGKNKR